VQNCNMSCGAVWSFTGPLGHPETCLVHSVLHSLLAAVALHVLTAALCRTCGLGNALLQHYSSSSLSLGAGNMRIDVKTSYVEPLELNRCASAPTHVCGRSGMMFVKCPVPC
jgi:hypothetical protein